MNILSDFSIINSNSNYIINKNHNKKPANFSTCNVDTFTFTGNNKTNSDASVNLDWITDNKVKNIVKTLQSKDTPALSISDVEKVLDYFGYDVSHKTETNDHHCHYEPYAYKGKGISFTITKGKEADIGCVGELKRALKQVNDTNGELMPNSKSGSKIQTPEEIAKFNEITSEYNSEGHNKYRRFLEEFKKQRETEDDKTKKTVSKRQQSTETRNRINLENTKDEILKQIEEVLEQDENLTQKIDGIGNNIDAICQLAKLSFDDLCLIQPELKEIKDKADKLKGDSKEEDTSDTTRRKNLVEELTAIKDKIEDLKTCKEAKSKLKNVNTKKDDYKRANDNLNKEADHLLNQVNSILNNIQDIIENGEIQEIIARLKKVSDKEATGKEATDKEPTVSSTEENNDNSSQNVDSNTEPIEQTTTTQEIQTEKEWAKNLFDNLAQQLSRVPAEQTISDMRAIVQNMFTEDELLLLETCPLEQFAEILQNKINSLAENNDFKEAKRAENFALIQYLTNTGKLKEDEDVFSKLPEIGMIASDDDTDFDKITELYLQYKQKLTPKQSDKIADSITSCIDNNNDTKTKMQDMLKDKCSYYELLTDTKTNKSVRTMLLKITVSDFDKMYGTNYLENIEEITEKFFKKDEERAKLEALKKLNFQVAFVIW